LDELNKKAASPVPEAVVTHWKFGFNQAMHKKKAHYLPGDMPFPIRKVSEK